MAKVKPRRGLPQQPQARVIYVSCDHRAGTAGKEWPSARLPAAAPSKRSGHEAARHSGRCGIIGQRRDLELSHARDRAGKTTLKMVTDWPEGLPGFYPSARRFAQTVEAATGGRIKIEVFLAGTFVR